MNVTLRQIRAFVAVAELGRFVLAANRLHVTQSALSMLVKELEGEMGLRLFDRNTRMLKLTEAGREFLPVAQKVLADLQVAVVRSHDLASLKRGRVSIAIASVLARTLLPPVIRPFSAQYPGIKIVVRDVPEEQIRPKVRSGEVDLGIGTSMEPDAEIAETPLFNDQLSFLCRIDHPLASRSSVFWRDLGNLPFIGLHEKSPIRALIDRAARDANVSLNMAYEVSFGSTVLAMVASGLGISILPVNARTMMHTEGVAFFALRRPVIQRQVSIFQREGTMLSPAAEAFTEFILQETAESRRAR